MENVAWIFSFPGRVQKTCRCGTSGHGLAGMVVLGWWLDLRILEIFSKSQWFYDFIIMWAAQFLDGIYINVRVII